MEQLQLVTPKRFKDYFSSCALLKKLFMLVKSLCLVQNFAFLKKISSCSLKTTCPVLQLKMCVSDAVFQFTIHLLYQFLLIRSTERLSLYLIVLLDHLLEHHLQHQALEQESLDIYQNRVIVLLEVQTLEAT